MQVKRDLESFRPGATTSLHFFPELADAFLHVVEKNTSFTFGSFADQRGFLREVSQVIFRLRTERFLKSKQQI